MTMPASDIEVAARPHTRAGGSRTTHERAAAWAAPSI
jgi:hypothetical protein